ncbi:hypothetical protein, partial [Xanthomonas sacchari]|uniref:hypothetical protein n=1 Tax=Xanthomonas sacchari TaxID=56458 RepID=UPI002258645F
AHQIVLEVLAETGVIGLLLWLAGAAQAWRAWRYASAQAWPSRRARSSRRCSRRNEPGATRRCRAVRWLSADPGASGG